MDFANIILIIVLVLIIIWVITRMFFTTNIIYDRILDASELSSQTTGVIDSLTNSNSNIIKNSDILENNTANFMLSVWFYIDNWGNNIGNEKNVLFMGNNENLTTPDDLKQKLYGISKKFCNVTESNNYKNLSVSLDNYENILNIDIETLPEKVESDPSGCLTRYSIKNIPIQKWNCLIISVDTKTMDIYLDGKLRNSFILHAPYKSDLGSDKKKNIYLGNINQNNIGFEGFITRIRYEPNSINPKEAYKIYKKGINASMAKSVFNKYSLKVSFMEYNKERGTFTI